MQALVSSPELRGAVVQLLSSCPLVVLSPGAWSPAVMSQFRARCWDGAGGDVMEHAGKKTCPKWSKSLGRLAIFPTILSLLYLTSSSSSWRVA